MRKPESRRSDSSSPARSPEHSKKRSIQSWPSSLLDANEQPLAEDSRSLAQLPTTHQPLSKEALRAHTLITALAYANQNYLNISRNQKKAAKQTRDDSYVGPGDPFNRKWGYLPPFDEESEQVIAFIIKHPALAETMARIQPGTSKFEKGLDDRNVDLGPNKSLDKCVTEIESLDIEDFMTEPTDEEKNHQLLWELDQKKITETSSEALFQRTIMVSLIARHFLIYPRDGCENQLFDFSVEEPWTCPPMPSRVLNSAASDQDVVALENKLLTQPKPDLALAFHRNAIMTDETWCKLPHPTRKLASFEKMDWDAFNTFHFLTIEAKNPSIPVGDCKALHQSLNCASQALFNYFEYFRDAGSKHEDLFFEKVRFFSIVTNRTGLLVRIHRAVKVPEDDIACRVIPDDPDYLLRFKFQVFTRIEGTDEFSRSKVLDVFKKILKYAKDTLCPLIRDATSDISTKLKTDMAFVKSRALSDVYRHGQPGVKSPKGSRRSDPAPSVNDAKMDFLQHGMQHILSSRHFSSIASDSMRTSQATSKPSNYRPRVPSKLGSTGKKRKASPTAIEHSNRSTSRDPEVSKRQRHGASSIASSSHTGNVTGIGT